jgi:predicted amidohydrolase
MMIPRNHTENRIVRVSTIQLPAVVDGAAIEEKSQNNMKQIREMLLTAGERKSDLVLLGEYSNLFHRSASTDPALYPPEEIPGGTTNIVAEIAKEFRMNVVFPMFGSFDGKISSYAVIIDRNGSVAGCYRKTHVTEQEQHLGMVPGDTLPVYHLDCCTIGCMTCMDIEYPEVAQILMLQGAEVLLFPHVQASWGEVDWEIRYRARAIDTGLYLVSSSYGYGDGTWLPGMLIGRSGIVGRDGLTIADAGRQIGVITTDIDIASRRITEFYFSEKLDRTLAIMASRRPELYQILSEPNTKINALKNLRRTNK